MKPEFNLLSHPFTTDIDKVPEDFQLELIDMQSIHLKGMFISVALTEFYESPSSDKFSCVKSFGRKMFFVFGSMWAYVRESSFLV